MKGIFELAQSSPRRMAGFLLALVSFGSLVLLVLFGRDVRGARPASFPRSAPDFVLSLDDGVRISSKDLLGKPTLLLFADPDCSSCVEVLPGLQRELEGTSGAALFLVTRTPALGLLGVSGRIRHARTALPWSDLGVTRVPAVAWIDRQGKLASVWTGPGAAREAAAHLRSRREPL